MNTETKGQGKTATKRAMTPFRQQVLDAVADRYRESYFVRVCARLTNRQNKAMLNALAWLEGQGLVRSEKIGNVFFWERVTP